MTLHALAMESPLGDLQLVSEADCLIELNWEGAHKVLRSTTRSEPTILTTAADELSQFFSGQRCEFSVPIKPKGTAFQLLVWRELQAIPWGCLLYTSDAADDP